MKTFWIILIIIIVGIGAFLLFGNKANGPTDNSAMEGENTGQSENMEGDTMPEGATMEDGTLTDEEMASLEDEVKEFDITGENFAFSETEIRVQKGDRVRINFSSTDGFHDWVVDEFSAATDRVSTGESTFVEFVADEAGEFEYYCSVGSHRELGMVGTLIVEDPAE